MQLQHIAEVNVQIQHPIVEYFNPQRSVQLSLAASVPAHQLTESPVLRDASVGRLFEPLELLGLLN